MGNREYKYSLHYLRAIAIIFIVSGHCLTGFPDRLFYNLLRTFLQGGTATFVFISGYFFSYLYKENYHYKKYLLNKLKKIIIPYLFLSTLFFIYYYIYKNFGFKETDDKGNLVLSYFYFLILGRIFPCYWYIPFAFLLFICSPLFILFKKLSVSIKISIILSGLFLSSIIHRPLDLINLFQHFLYYIPFYLLGIVYEEYQVKADSFILKFRFFCISAILSLSVLIYQVAVIKHVGNYHKELFKLSGIDLNIYSKLFFSAALIYISNIISYDKHIILYEVGAASFSIYFLHTFFIYNYNNSIEAYSGNVIHDFSLMILKTVCAVGLSYLSAKIIKNIFGRKSQFLIGY